MIFLSELIEWTACLTEVGIFYWMAGKAFKDERRNVRIYWDWIFTACLATVILVINNIVLYSTFTLLIWMLLGSISAAALYRVSYIKLLSLALFYTVCFCSTDMLASNLYLSLGKFLNINGNTIMTFSLQRIGLLIFAKLLMVVFIVSLRKLFIPLFRSEYEKRILLVSLIAFLFVLYYRKPAQSSFSVEVSSIFGLLVVLCSLGVYVGFKYLENQNEKMQNRAAKIQNELLRENYQAVSALYESNAKLYHDLNNHLDILYQMLAAKRLDEAKEYISQISEPMKEMVKKRYTGNDIIDVILSSKKQKAEQLGIKTEIDAEFPVNTGIQPNDICTVLGNLMDNAIEGSKDTDNARICLKIHRVHQFILIQISNTTSKQPKIEKETGRWITDKADRTRHGWGMESVKSTLKKYNGTMQFQFQEEELRITVLLFF
ncbi:MAG: GHKL domain-containing protein [Lachnospiraceae bacterium]|nr:GHKL domain-containing protein [Lachnospiraceae bacterium]